MPSVWKSFLPYSRKLFVIKILLSPDLQWELCLFLAEHMSTAGINSIRLFCKFFIVSCIDVSYLHCNIQLKTYKLDLGKLDTEALCSGDNFIYS